mmetsp:Transcript_2578/g.6530  ORF Transcript_2578/g.6530 Transcript_2578/m.6530 type:complete len:303 (+) Transcript_2578:94-1002(+)
MCASPFVSFAAIVASLGIVLVRADLHLRGATTNTTTTTASTIVAATAADGLIASPDLTEAVKASATPPPGASAVDFAAGVPGGWGESADFAAAIRAEGPENVTLRAQWSDFDDDGYNGWGHSGSCAAFGCINYYAPWHDCQCNDDCSKYGSCCKDYSLYCHKQQQPTPAPQQHHHHAPSSGHKRRVMTLYHQTNQHAATLIKQHGFRPGSSGWCGGAIYFATSTQATYTKAIGPDSHKGAMLECQVDVGRVLHQDRRCGGHAHNQAELDGLGYDSIQFNPGDGDEYVIWDKSKVLSIKQIPI